MRMEKRQETAFLVYFVLLSLLVLASIRTNIDIVNLIYLVVVFSCTLKFILIVNKDKK